MKRIMYLLTAYIFGAFNALAVDYTDIQTIGKSGEYNFKSGSYNDQLLDQDKVEGETVINIENGGLLNVTRTGSWSIIDIHNGSDYTGENDPASTITINGNLNLVQTVKDRNDSRIINLLKGNTLLTINGDVTTSFESSGGTKSKAWFETLRNYDGAANLNGNINLAMNINDNTDNIIQVNGVLTYGDAVTNIGTSNKNIININKLSVSGNNNFQSVIGINSIEGITNLNSAVSIANISSENSGGDIELIAIQAGEKGVVNVNGDLYINGLSAVSINGTTYVAALVSYEGGIINVNENGDQEHIIQIVGDIDADDASTGTAINLKLTNKESFLQGAANSGDGNINMTLSNNAVWKILNRALVGNENYDANKKNSSVSNLSGNGGIIQMDIDASSGDANRLYINGVHKGIHYIQLNNTGSDISGAEGTILVSVQDEQGEFKAGDTEGNLYWNTYELSEKTENVTDGYSSEWYLKKVEKVDVEEKKTTSVDTILSSNALIYHTWRNENDTMLKRLGDLHLNKNSDSGSWVRIHSSKINRNDNNNFENKYVSYDMGYDIVAQNTSELTSYMGFALNYLKGNSHYSSGKGDNYNANVALYNTYLYNNNSYIDIMLKTGYFNNDFKVKDSNQKYISGKMENYGFSLSGEIGCRFYTINNLFIEPQAQLTIGRLIGDTYKTNNEIKVNQKDIDSTIGRVGFNLGYDFSKGLVYVKTGILHEFKGESSIKMTNRDDSILIRSKFNDSWMEYGIGMNWMINEQSYAYSSAECGKGEDYDADWSFEVGFRYNF